MGYLAHHTMVFLDEMGDRPFAEKAREIIAEATKDRGPWEKPESWQALFIESPLETPVNHGRTYVFFPDASKEGWETSDIGDAIRERLAELAESMHIEYVEVRFGGSEPELGRIIRRSEED
jgi:hypothetical protein